MTAATDNLSIDKVDKICSRLQLLLRQWEDSVPVISNASASTLLSQIKLFISICKEKSEKSEKEGWAMHEMPFLLIQTVSQLWDQEVNILILHQSGIVKILKDMYEEMASILLPLLSFHTDDNRFSEFLNILSSIVFLLIIY